MLTLAGRALAEPPPAATLTAALEAIRDRALTPGPLPVIALEGMKGLAALDPTLAVTITAEHRIQLVMAGRSSSSFAAPPEDDVAGWVRLIGQVTREAGRHSRSLASADPALVNEAVIDGFLSKLDIFSHYAGPLEARERRAARNGFGGIGVRFDSGDGGVSLTEIMPDSPAAVARLKIGDRLLAIDAEKVAGLDQAGIALRLRGPIGSPITLALQRVGETAAAPVTLHRALVVPPTVSLTQDQGIAVIAVAAFNQNTAAGVATALKKAKAAPGFKGIVLDLRGNPGGLLDQGVTVADLFIAQGRILVTRGRHPDAAQSQDARPGDPGEGVPLVVLIDGGTASAAEILAADLQDLGHAVLVGSNSFGKGAIQTVLDLPDGGEMTLTWSRFYAPSGYALHGLGVLPAICTVPAGSVQSDRPLAGGRAAPPETLAAWRGVAADDLVSRFRLRGHCLASDHVGDANDLAIARHLLQDRALFARALAVTDPPPTALARNHGGER